MTGISHSSVVDAPLAEVFAWFGRPGAFRRLAPPWQPVSIVEEAGSLRDGRAVLALPGGLRWSASHQADGYDPPRRFVDKLTTPLLSEVLRWKHIHQFAPAGPDRTLVTDTVDSRVPTFALRAMFTYRHQQLAEDLAAHARYRSAPLTIAVTGASGLIGTALTSLLTTGGHRVIRLVRRPPRDAGERHWRPDDPSADLLSEVDAVVHLAGKSIAGRFTESHKQGLRASRIGPTGKLAAVAARCGVKVFVSASAIGYYGPDRGDSMLTEDSPRGDGFLADLVADWEAEAASADLRSVCVRTGIVQTPRGGVLGLQYPLFLAGLGGRLGSGSQWLSWIGIDDLTDIYLRAIIDPALQGPVNAVAPEPVRNAEYTRTLADVLRRPAILPVPSLGPRLLLGDDGARELALASQRVVPRKLEQMSHVYRQPKLETALRHLLGRVHA
ncbi:TIGR01777 family oxidoreductase [Actinocrispum sp. NPDC049592]|uniref:TIGR01777 family oxidoreductase n=1 Tax=Actinocrispum sp. NPDC049592 TaxID=3154835 RepID=UPI0034317B4F